MYKLNDNITINENTIEYLTKIGNDYICVFNNGSKLNITEVQFNELKAKDVKYSKSIVIKDSENDNIFNTTDEFVEIVLADRNTLTDVNGDEIQLENLALGDNVYIIELDIIDRYVGSITETSIKFYKLESTKVDLTRYATKDDLNTKQDVLTPGTGITIENNVISASGGGGDLYAHYITCADGIYASSTKIRFCVYSTKSDAYNKATFTSEFGNKIGDGTYVTPGIIGTAYNSSDGFWATYITVSSNQINYTTINQSGQQCPTSTFKDTVIKVI